MGILDTNPIVGSVVGIVATALDKIFPDPIEAQKAKLALLQAEQAGAFKQMDQDLQLAQGQIDTNKVEAASESLFVSGWRPFVGWTCGTAFAFKYIGGPLLFMIAQVLGRKIDLPVIDTTEMMPLLFGLLGLGAYRSFEKIRGVIGAGK